MALHKKIPSFIIFSAMSISSCIPVIDADTPNSTAETSTATATDFPTPTPTSTPTPAPAFEFGEPDAPLVDTRTRDMLLNTQVPLRDPIDLALRLLGKENIARTLPPPTSNFEVGDSSQFWTGNNDTAQKRQLDATLQYVTEHAYFWIEDSILFQADDLKELTDTFEAEIYPVTRAFFGSEWSPGVDGDEHIYILLAKDIGTNVAGYFSAGDEYPPESQTGSNGHEMFVLSADNLNLSQTFTYSVLAHEFQHMIHWNLDRNETSFINEGLSEVSQLLNGYTEEFAHNVYLANPDYQLNDWPNGSSTTPNYGASFLFLLYFLERVGNIGISELVAEPANGLQGLDRVIEKLDLPPAQQLLTADDLMIDWVLSNYVDDTSVEDGRYGYEKYPLDLQVSPTETDRDCATTPHYRDVHQYGVDYIRVICEGQQTMLFEGNVETKLLPEDAYSGEYAFWSNKGHQSDLTLSRTFDFSEYAGSLTFNYWTWFDIETDWDYVYVLASTDGVKWEMLATPSGTDSDPSGNNYGWGLTGLSGYSGEWIQESVDISQFAGQVVQLRFEYITDTAVNGEGMLIDDISIPEVGYFSDFESDADGWTADGFVRVVNALPQTFRIAMISIGDKVSVTYISLDDFNRAIMALDFAEFDEYIFVVVGTTRFTRELADYSFSFVP